MNHQANLPVSDPSRSEPGKGLSTNTGMNQGANLPTPSSHATSEQQERRHHGSSKKELHKCISSAITMLAALLPINHGAEVASLFVTDRVTMLAFIVALLVYFGSYAAKILQAHDNPDLAEVMDKISLLSGTFALNLELLITVPALGWFAIFVWSICLAIVVSKSYHQSAVEVRRLYQSGAEEFAHASDKLKELFRNIIGHLTKDAELQNGLPV
ncbi:PREDICTED: PRUPE_3G261100 [Prunus dulcis]|uniref:PREDICTED: PRUPE_3G261100 n=1 Tax=Prunus dulcis TaxID=3755 RepID=A0A5E4GG66_PRUDU|nr:PREDICTED: PRUPE_3G261100 [Prunus dulcis]